MNKMILAVVLAIAFACSLLAYTEKTQRWVLGETWGAAHVTVFDTTGVCVYVVSSSYGAGIAAVPKTQIPAGAGCQ